jgi:hypothetical protein
MTIEQKASNDLLALLKTYDEEDIQDVVMTMYSELVELMLDMGQDATTMQAYIGQIEEDLFENAPEE